MGIKKKLGMGVLSAALGLSLVGGGTWAAFNDVEKIENHFAAGTLDLKIEANKKNSPISFDLKNMKPEDTVARQFKLTNNGSLAIKEVLMNMSVGTFKSGTGSNQEATEFLKQFKVEFIKADDEPGGRNPQLDDVIIRGQTLTLADLASNNFIHKIEREYRASDGTQRINLAPLVSRSNNSGLPANGDSDLVQIKIEFINDKTREDGSFSKFVQNKFQDNSINFDFHLEATQWDGIDVEYDDRNGSVNNGVTRSADGNNAPNPRTIP